MRGTVLLLLLTLGFLPAALGSGSNPFPSCLAGFCLDGKLPTEQTVLKRFGGQAVPSGYKTRGYCYRFTSSGASTYGLFLLKNRGDGWRIVSVRVADTQLCDKPTSITRELSLGTKEGIAIGAQKAIVEAAYGRPRYSLDSRSKVLAYLIGDEAARQVDGANQYVPDDQTILLSAIFVFRNGRVSAIEVSADE